MKTLYLVTRSQARKGLGNPLAYGGSQALNAFAITFVDRMPAAEDRT
jgi:putative transposase